MSSGSSSAGGWFTRLERARPVEGLVRRPDDPRLAEVIESWRGDPTALRPGRAVLIGFPQDEGVLRNHGRTGAAEAPDEIRRWLYRLAPWDPETDVDLAQAPPLDLGNLRIEGSLEETQEALAEVVAEVLGRGAVPVVLGGGHETAYGHYLGYVAASRPVGIINIDAHLDVRPLLAGRGHSGSPFRQALEHPTAPLPGPRYVCLGAQPHATTRRHWAGARERGCVIRWCGELRPSLAHHLAAERDRLAAAGCQVHVSVDADAVRTADVPGVSAPNPAGLAGAEVLAAARLAGRSPQVSSLDLVEINPRQDRDGQSARWGALLIWNFLIGLLNRDGPAGPLQDAGPEGRAD
jgi:formiminoglutamase